jgi:hypothetical protein
MNEETLKPKGLVGSRANKSHILAWNYCDELDIRVTADRLGPSGWGVRLKSGDEIRFIGTVLGGRGLAWKICEALRDAMTARRMKHRKQTARRAARRAAEENPSNPSNLSNLSNP